MLNSDINAGLADPQLKATIKDLGGETCRCRRPNSAKFIADETEKWAKVVKFADIKPD